MLDTIKYIRQYVEHDDENDAYILAVKSLCDVGEQHLQFSPTFQDILATELADTLNYLDGNCEIVEEKYTIIDTRTRLNWFN